jgi:hypothetical protein
MTSKIESFSWDEGWGLSSGGMQEENTFFGYQYLFPPVEGPREQHTATTKKGSEHTGSNPAVDLLSNAVRSNAERSITPGRRKGNRRREGEEKRGQKDTDINKKRWYQSKNKDMQEQSSREEPQDGDELLGKKDRPKTREEINWLKVQKPTRKQLQNADELLGKKDRQQTGDEKNRLQVQKKSEDTPASSNFMNFLFDKGNDGMGDHAPNDTSRVTKQSATESDRSPTNGSDSAGDNSLPFLNYFWTIQPLEEAPTLSRPRSTAILEARNEGVLSEKSLQKDDEAPLRVHRLKRWFSTTSKQGDFGSSLDPKTDQDRNNDTQGPWLQEEVPGRNFSRDYGISVEAALREEDNSKSRNCMSFRRNPEVRGSGVFLSRALSKLSLDPKTDQDGKNDREFVQDYGASVEDAPEEEDFSKSRNCMSFRMNPEARGSASHSTPEQDYGAGVEDASEGEEDYSKSRNCMSLRRNPEARGSGNGNFFGRGLSKLSFEENVPGSGSGQDNGLGVDDVREPRNCMSFRKNPGARGGGIFSGRAQDESKRESTSRRDTLTIEEEEVRRKGRRLVTVVRYDSREGSQEELLQYGPKKSRDDDDDDEDDERLALQCAPRVESRVMGEHERSARRNWLARHGTLDQDYGANVDDALEQDGSETRNCMPLRRSPRSRAGGIFVGRLEESRRESTSRRDALPIEEEEEEVQRVDVRDVSRLQDVSKQEQDRTLAGKERVSSSLPAATKLTSPAKEPLSPAKGRQTVSICRSRSDIEERVQPLSPKGASLWRGDLWGLMSLSVDSLEAEESTARVATRKPIRIDRSTSRKKGPADVCSIRAASWDSYDDEECYSNSSASSVFSLESLEAW